MTATEVANAKEALTGSAEVIVGHLRAAGIDRGIGELVEAGGERTLLVASVHGGCMPGSDADRGIGEGTIWGIDCACPLDPQGLLLAARHGADSGAPLGVASLLDVAPTLLALIGRRAGTELTGQCLVEAADTRVRQPGEDDLSQGGYSDKEEAIVSERLRGLGYIE
jgi:hypothetical protein